MRKFWLASFLGLIASAGLAHDFWVQPLAFSLAQPGPVPLAMFVGHGPARERWGLASDRVVVFSTLGPDGLVDRKANLSLGAARADALVPLSRPGSYVFVLQSTAAVSRLPFLRFNEYVAAEGIAPIAAERIRRQQTREDGSELYSRRAKAIVQVGPIDAASIARVTRPANLVLEIVPERHPQALGADRTLPVRVLFKGRPLPGALVKITDLAADAETAASRRTDGRGRAVFTIPRAGRWQMNVIWAEPLRGDPRADFRTTFSSLTFAST